MNRHDLQAMRAPDLIEPVIGFRQWRMASEGLLSITCEEKWPEATLVARCLASRGGDCHPQHAAPVSACSCGIHAWYKPCPRTASAPTRDWVAGAVVLWGAIELHGSGMRAQHCRIVALALPLSCWGKRRRLVEVARRLGVPAVRHCDLEAIASSHGAPVPMALRPPPSSIRFTQRPNTLKSPIPN